MKIAITGAGGFLGTELLRQLSVYEDTTIYAFTFDFERERATFVTADNIIAIDNSEAECFDYSEIDVLINCAFPRNVSDESFAKGLDFLQKVVVKSAKDKVGAFINISSQSVYSQTRKEPADESTPAVLETKYAVGKYFSELFVNSSFENIRHTNLRMASLIGAGFNQRLTNKFVQRVIAGEQLAVSGGDQLFGFLDVRDAASAIITVARSDKEWEPVYNLGTNNAYTLLGIAEEVISVGKQLGYTAPEPMVSESDNWQNSSIDCTRFYETFSWSPEYSLRITITDIFKDIIDSAEK